MATSDYNIKYIFTTYNGNKNEKLEKLFQSFTYLSIEDFNLLIYDIFIIINKQHNNNYKLSYYENLIYLLVSTLDNYMKKEGFFYYNIECSIKILKILSSVKHGYKYLEKIKNLININNLNEIKLLSFCIKKSDIMTFLFWVKMFNSNKPWTFIDNVIYNSDIRVLKYIVNNYHLSHLDIKHMIIKLII